ncbi:MAG: hypothetical protein EBV34_22465 [Betaproteobacteria bacterium]|nr:hypothetical protein [Betaproteobacteria bacterium]
MSERLARCVGHHLDLRHILQCKKRIGSRRAHLRHCGIVCRDHLNHLIDQARHARLRATRLGRGR